MTLALTCIGPGLVVQASDRLVTNSSTGQVFDASSNKTLILRARDALVALSYSGVAHLGGQTTDEQLANAIVGQELRSDGQGFLGVGLRGKWPTLGQAVGRMKALVQTELSRLPKESRQLEIGVTGWRWGRGRIAPTWVALGFQPNSVEPVLSGIGRRWLSEPARRAFAHFPAVLTSEEAESIPRVLVRASSLPEAEEGMAEAIRRVSDRVASDTGRRTIGRNVMVVALPRPASDLRVRVSFLAAEEERAGLVLERDTIEFAPSYTPWILVPGAFLAPSLMAGHEAMAFGDLQIEQANSSPPAGRFHVISSQRRPPAPGAQA